MYYMHKDFNCFFIHFVYNRKREVDMSTSRIKDIRKQKGLTQQELADKLGLSQAQVARLESGSSDITLEQMRSFAKVLNCEPWELLPLDMQPKIDHTEMELVRLLRTLNSTAKMDNTSEDSKVG